jgi:acyl-CoA synthetase (AMP-forming)/AMP-acid ligase II
VSRILSAVLEHARTRPGAVAVRELGIGGDTGDTTWAALARLADGHATRLGPGSGLVTIPTRRSAESISIMLGAMAAGRPFAFLDPRLRPPQIERIEARAKAHDPGGETGCVLFTSGSTGEPKGVRVGRDDLSARAAAEITAFGLEPDDRLLSLLVFAFDVGLNQLLTSLVVGSTLVILQSWLPADVLDAARNQRITGISAVPSIWRAFLLAGLGFGNEEHRHLRYLTISGGDLASPHLARMSELAGPAGIIKTYGQTETFRSAMLGPSGFADRPESVGRKFPGARFVVDEGTG